MPKGTIDNAQRRSRLSQFEALLASRTLRSGMQLHIQQCTRPPFKQRITQSKYQECHGCKTAFALTQLWAMNMLLFTFEGSALPHSPLPPGIRFFQVPFSSALPITPPSSWLLPASHYLPSLDHSFLSQCCVCVSLSLLAHHFASYIIFINTKG